MKETSLPKNFDIIQEEERTRAEPPPIAQPPMLQAVETLIDFKKENKFNRAN